MNLEYSPKVHQKVAELVVPYVRSLHAFPGVPPDFRPWECNDPAEVLSPSALYNCSVTCRKRSGIKTPEIKWMSIKRWVTTAGGIVLPPGVYFSIKRKEQFVPCMTAGVRPRFDKKEFVVMLFPYGNVWSQVEPETPITEEWLFSEPDGRLVLESLMVRDAAWPVPGYFEACYRFWKDHPDMRGIHLKRKRNSMVTGSP